MLDSIALEQIDRDNPLTIGAEYRSGRKVQGTEIVGTSATVRRYANDLILSVDGWIDGDNGACSIKRPGYGYLAMTLAQARTLRDALTAALECQPDTSAAGGASHDPRADYDEPAALGRHPLA